MLHLYVIDYKYFICCYIRKYLRNISGEKVEKHYNKKYNFIS
jgi:hypothetical protein